MKKLLPVFIPIALIGALFLILLNTNKLQSSSNPFPSTTPSDQDKSSNDTEQIIPVTPAPLDVEESAPKAILVEDDDSPPSYSATEYPFVNQPYKWKKQGAWSHKYNISFNSDGSVSQDFLPRSQSVNLHWWPNNRYSIILSNDKGWTADIVLDTTYSKFTARRRGQKETFSGKRSR